MENKRVVLITGCAKGGIGYEYCKSFASRNCFVIASDIANRLSDIDTDLIGSDNVDPIELDVASDESVQQAVSKILRKYGKIDVLVNNAGIGSTGPLAELSLDTVRRAWEINTLGQLRLVQAVVPSMIMNRSGRIVNIGSIVGTNPTPWAGSYCASKAMVHAMSDSLRLELKPFNVQVIKVLPGAIRSNLGQANMKSLGMQKWKLYSMFDEAIAERAGASQGAWATDAKELAEYVSRRVLSKRPPRQIVFGSMTGLFALLRWSPAFVTDWFFTRRFGLNKKLW